MNISFTLKGDAHNYAYGITSFIVSPNVWLEVCMHNRDPIWNIVSEALQINLDSVIRIKNN